MGEGGKAGDFHGQSRQERLDGPAALRVVGKVK